MSYERKTVEFLKQLAIDTADGKVFTDQHLSQQLTKTEKEAMLPHVFMAFAVLTKEEFEELKSYNIQLIFEYVDKASQHTYAGYPIFTSMQLLDEQDANKFWDYFEKEKAAR